MEAGRIVQEGGPRGNLSPTGDALRLDLHRRGQSAGWARRGRRRRARLRRALPVARARRQGQCHGPTGGHAFAMPDGAGHIAGRRSSTSSFSAPSPSCCSARRRQRDRRPSHGSACRRPAGRRARRLRSAGTTTMRGASMRRDQVKTPALILDLDRARPQHRDHGRRAPRRSGVRPAAAREVAQMRRDRPPPGCGGRASARRAPPSARPRRWRLAASPVFYITSPCPPLTFIERAPRPARSGRRPDVGRRRSGNVDALCRGGCGRPVGRFRCLCRSRLSAWVAPAASRLRMRSALAQRREAQRVARSSRAPGLLGQPATGDAARGTGASRAALQLERVRTLVARAHRGRPAAGDHHWQRHRHPLDRRQPAASLQKCSPARSSFLDSCYGSVATSADGNPFVAVAVRGGVRGVREPARPGDRQCRPESLRHRFRQAASRWRGARPARPIASWATSMGPSSSSAVRRRSSAPSIELLTSHCDPTVNLYSAYQIVRGDQVVDRSGRSWPAGY